MRKAQTQPTRHRTKNNTTIPQLKLACRHIKEMMALDMTENHAIRLLELIADVYAKVASGGKAKPYYVGDVPLSWPAPGSVDTRLS
jgi:hypothetical protein